MVTVLYRRVYCRGPFKPSLPGLQVHKAREKLTGQQFAIKILNKAQIVKERKSPYVMVEKEALSRLDSSFFVKLYYTFQDAESLCM
jgi:hypothetical protein